MNVLVVARTEMVDDADGLTHQVHHVLWVGTSHFVLSQDLADSLAEHKANIGDSVLVSQHRPDLCGGHSGFPHFKNEGLNGILVGV